MSDRRLAWVAIGIGVLALILGVIHAITPDSAHGGSPLGAAHSFDPLRLGSD